MSGQLQAKTYKRIEREQRGGCKQKVHMAGGSRANTLTPHKDHLSMWYKNKLYLYCFQELTTQQYLKNIK